jgi:integrase
MTVIRKREWTSPMGESKSAWLVDYRDNFGNRRSKQFARKKDAEAWLVNASWEVSQGLHTADSQSITVAVAAGLWIAKAEADDRERSTIKQYRELTRLHVVPLLGEQKLSRLSRPMVENYRDVLISTRSKAMTQKAVRALSSILSEAQRRGLVAQNVARGVKVERKGRDKAKIEIPTREELKSLISEANATEKPIVMTAIMTGLRSSELRGLRWQDVDFNEMTVSVSQRADQWGQIGPPKSEAGYRSIPMASGLASVLKEWKLRSLPNSLDLVFPNANGKPLWHQNLLRRLFIPLQVKAGLTKPHLDRFGRIKKDGQGEQLATGKYGLHSLRHAAASGWIVQKIDLKRLQSWMGHSGVQITLDTYGHLIEDKEQDAAIAEAAQAYLT